MTRIVVEELTALAQQWAEQLYPTGATVGEPSAEMTTDDGWRTATLIVRIPVTPTAKTSAIVGEPTER
jgi:hypothetical protein